MVSQTRTVAGKVGEMGLLSSSVRRMGEIFLIYLKVAMDRFISFENPNSKQLLLFECVSLTKLSLKLFNTVVVRDDTFWKAIKQLVYCTNHVSYHLHGKG